MRSSRSSSLQPITLPLIRRSVLGVRESTHDAKPLIWEPHKQGDVQPFSQGAITTKESAATVQVCPVCCRNEARYTCPKCGIVYCSVECYRSHRDRSGGSGENSCTEAFYRERVSQTLQLDAKEISRKTELLLDRVHRERSADSFGESTSAGGYSIEELHEILLSLERDDEKELSRLMQSAKLKTAIRESIDRGELQEWLLDPWHPWWRPKLGSVTEENSEDIAKEETQEPARKTLDERLLAVTTFSSLRPNESEPPVQLRFNLVEILYSVARTLRLYHGVTNAVEESVHSANTLVNSSTVLSNDTRFESLEGVLAACTASSTQALEQKHDCNVTWSILTRDVALICSNRRLVARALLESTDIVRACAAELKKVEDYPRASRMRRIRKKIEYYLSWSIGQSEVLSGLGEDIEVWTAEWKHSDSIDDVDDLVFAPNSKNSMWEQC